MRFEDLEQCVQWMARGTQPAPNGGALMSHPAPYATHPGAAQPPYAPGSYPPQQQYPGGPLVGAQQQQQQYPGYPGYPAVGAQQQQQQYPGYPGAQQQQHYPAVAGGMQHGLSSSRSVDGSLYGPYSPGAAQVRSPCF